MDDMENASPLKQAAIMGHEMYTELKNAGFSKREALELVAKMFTTAASAAFEEGNSNND